MIIFASQLTQRSYTWTNWKTVQADKNLVYQYEDDSNIYTIWGYDGPEVHFCIIWKGTVPDGIIGSGYSQNQNDVDKSDFETNYLSTANSVIESRTKDGRLQVKNSTANRCTNFNLRVFSFYTASTSKLHNINPVTDASFGDVAVTLYDINGNVTNTGSSAVKTVVDFEPHYNYEIIGGYMDVPGDILGNLTDTWYMSVIGVPDYPAPMGSVSYISEVNVEAITDTRIISDGRAVSYLPYNYGGYPHTNRLRFVFKHPSGLNNSKRFQIYLEHFI